MHKVSIHSPSCEESNTSVLCTSLYLRINSDPQPSKPKEDVVI